MFLLRPPSPAQVRAFLNQSRAAALSYRETGWTLDGRTPDWARNGQHRVRVGQGAACWERARAALNDGQMFQDWVLRQQEEQAGGEPERLYRQGDTVALLVRHLGPFGQRQWGLYSLIANRVLYLIDAPGRYGFGYGTLSGHLVRGEERFLLEQDAAGVVWFELTTFSRAAVPLVALAQPFVELAQRRGAAHYARMLVRAAGCFKTPPPI